MLGFLSKNILWLLGDLLPGRVDLLSRFSKIKSDPILESNKNVISGFTSYGYFPTTATSNVTQVAGKNNHMNNTTVDLGVLRWINGMW